SLFTFGTAFVMRIFGITNIVSILAIAVLLLSHRKMNADAEQGLALNTELARTFCAAIDGKHSGSLLNRLSHIRRALGESGYNRASAQGINPGVWSQFNSWLSHNPENKDLQTAQEAIIALFGADAPLGMEPSWYDSVRWLKRRGWQDRWIAVLFGVVESLLYGLVLVGAPYCLAALVLVHFFPLLAAWPVLPVLLIITSLISLSIYVKRHWNEVFHFQKVDRLVLDSATPRDRWTIIILGIALRSIYLAVLLLLPWHLVVNIILAVFAECLVHALLYNFYIAPRYKLKLPVGMAICAPEEGIFRSRPNIVIISTPPSELEKVSVAENWSALASRLPVERSVNVIIVDKRFDIFGVEDGRLFIESGRIFDPSRDDFVRLNFEGRVEGHYGFGVRDLSSGGYALEQSGFPMHDSRAVRETETNKIVQVETVRQLGFPTKEILARFKRGRIDRFLDDAILDELEEHLNRLRETGMLAVYIQPHNASWQQDSAIFDISHPEGVRSAIDFLRRATDGPEGEYAIMIILAYISSFPLADVYTGLSNDMRVIVTRGVGSELLVGPITVNLRREIGRRGESYFATMHRLMRMPLDEFLEHATDLSEDAQHAFRREVSERSKAIARGFLEGCNFDILAVDYIISDVRDENGLPELYFIEAAANFSGEMAWDMMSGRKGAFRGRLFSTAVERAGEYKRALAGEGP
ncbi:MAG: hypothetical protein WC658_05460, partial [Candidatus Omnitrophota bacterium]